MKTLFEEECIADRDNLIEEINKLGCFLQEYCPGGYDYAVWKDDVIEVINKYFENGKM